MTIDAFLQKIESLLREDNLSAMADGFITYCEQAQPESEVSAKRYQYVKKEALALEGRIKQLDRTYLLESRISFDEYNRNRADIRAGLNTLTEILKNPNFTSPELEKALLIRTGRKIGKVMLVIWGVLFLIVLSGVFFVFSIVYKGFRKFDNLAGEEPKEITYHPINCYLTTKHGVQLLAKASLDAPHIGQLPNDKKYLITEVKKVPFGPITQHYFFKITDESKGWTGWVQEMPMSMEVDPNCYKE